MDTELYDARKAQLGADLDAARKKVARIEKRLKVLEALKDPEDEAAARELLAELREGKK